MLILDNDSDFRNSAPDMFGGVSLELLNGSDGVTVLNGADGTPFYKKAWFWGSIAAAAAVTGAVVIYRRRRYSF